MSRSLLPISWSFNNMHLIAGDAKALWSRLVIQIVTCITLRFLVVLSASLTPIIISFWDAISTTCVRVDYYSILFWLLRIPTFALFWRSISSIFWTVFGFWPCNFCWTYLFSFWIPATLAKNFMEKCQIFYWPVTPTCHKVIKPDFLIFVNIAILVQR